MRKILLLFLSLSILSCSDSKNDFESKYPDYSLNKINFLNKNFYLPDNYQNASSDSIFQSSLNSIKSIDSLSLNKQKYLRLLDSGAQFEYFIDTKNPENTITFILGEYISLNENTMNKFVEILKMKSFKKDIEQNYRYHLEQKKFYKLSYADVVKVKFKRIKNEEELYLSQYLISQGLETMTMIITNSNNEDYDELIKNFNL